jgi:transposase
VIAENLTIPLSSQIISTSSVAVTCEVEMLSVDQHAAIRHAFYTEHKSVREIARDLDVSRQTVRKAIAQASPSRYTLHSPRRAPKLDAFRERILALLDEQQRQPLKQRYTGVRIFQILQDEGYTGSDSHLRAYIGQLKQHRQPPKTFLPLAFQPGQDAQADWGEAQAIIAGVRQTVQLFVMRLCYAHRTFAIAFPTQRQEAFFAAHVAAFSFFAGVPHRISYDNLTTAVQPSFTGRTRTEQQAFTAFRSYYLFDSHFCNLAAAHEKGQVEHSVGHVRRNALVPLPSVASFDELNALLLHWCEQQDARVVHGQPATIGAMWIEEHAHLRPLPPQSFPCCRTTTVTLTPYSQVVFETNRYSVPSDQAVRLLTLRAFPLRVDILNADTLLASHPRCYGHDQDVCDPLHYLALLAKRPGALEHAKPIVQWKKEWPAAYTRLLARLRQQWPDGRGVREFVQVLQLHQQHDATLIEKAVEQALTIGCVHADGVRLLVQQLVHPDQNTSVLDLHDRPHLAQVGTQPLDLNVYERLLTGEQAQ